MPDLKVLTSLAGKWYPAIYLLRGFLGFVRKLKEDWARVDFLFWVRLLLTVENGCRFLHAQLGAASGKRLGWAGGLGAKGPRTGVLKTGA